MSLLDFTSDEETRDTEDIFKSSLFIMTSYDIRISTSILFIDHIRTFDFHWLIQVIQYKLHIMRQNTYITHKLLELYHHTLYNHFYRKGYQQNQYISMIFIIYIILIYSSYLPTYSLHVITNYAISFIKILHSVASKKCG